MSKTDRELKVYSNADDVDVSKIPQSVINDLANIFYDIFTRMEAEKQVKDTAENNNEETAAE
ncbi:MAG: hypothetical protein ACI4A5_01470 [Hominilimicola sp.]